MAEMEKPRETFIKVRGAYDKNAEKVTAAFPAFLPKPATDATNHLTRLDLARWLAAPEHPLTARVQVNRMWQHFFGAGIVSAEVLDGVLDRRDLVVVRHVTRNPNCEYVADALVEQDLRWYARVRTGNDRGVRMLALRSGELHSIEGSVWSLGLARHEANVTLLNFF